MTTNQIVCTMHGGCSPSECFDLHHQRREVIADTRCGMCRIGDHELCTTPEILGRVSRCCDGIATGPTNRGEDP